MLDNQRHETSYYLWRDHNKQAPQNNDVSTLALLREAYPQYHVTETYPDACDLLGYAEAGHAMAILEDTRFTLATRSYDAPESRLDKDKGKVTDNVRYGCYRYHWRGIDFLVYKATYVSRWGTRKLLFVLHPDGPEKRINGATDALLLECGKWSKDLHEEIYVFDNVEWKKSKELWKSVDGSSWDDVILEAGMKERLIHDVQSFFDTRHIYQASRVPWKRGVILHGVPGNGKTVSVKALINSLAKREEPIPSLYVKSLDGCQGPKYSIQLIFKRARAMAPCLLVFEDLDSLVTPKTRSYFLNEVDGLESNDGILMIGSTNYLNRLDAAITKRPSRFDRKYHFKLPDEQARLAYAMYWSRKFTGPNDIVDFPEGLGGIIAEITDGFSFAYMKELFIASLLALAREAADGSPPEDTETDLTTEAVAGGKAPSENSAATSEEPVIVEVGGKTDSAEDSSPQPEKKAQVVQIKIPENLKGNAFLRIVIKQAAILQREMESTDKGEDAPMGCGIGVDSDPPLFSPVWFAMQAEQIG